MNILNLIPKGKDNAISRENLVALTGMSDREVRKHISELRYDYPILNLQNGSGYYRPTRNDREELLHYYYQERKRAISIFTSLSATEKALGIIPGQTSLL